LIGAAQILSDRSHTRLGIPNDLDNPLYKWERSAAAGRGSCPDSL